MIPNMSELLVLQSKYDAKQKAKDNWREARLDALEY